MMANFDNAFRQRRLADLMNSDDPESMDIVRQIQNEDANETARLGNYPAPQQPNFDNEARRLSNYALPQRAPHDAYESPNYANEDARLRNYAPQQPNFDNEARRLGNYPATLANLVNPVSQAQEPQQQQQQQPQQRAELQPNSFRNERTGVVTKLSDTPPMWAGQSGQPQPEVLEERVGFDKNGDQDGTMHQIIRMPAQNGAAAYTRFAKVYMPGRSPNDVAQAKIDREKADIRRVNTSTDIAIQNANRKEDKVVPQLPPASLKMQQEALDAIAVSKGISADSAALKQQIASGNLDIGPVQNKISEARNYFGFGDKNSAEYGAFVGTIEKLRNDSLLLNKGVQTEGDSQRAMNQLMSNLNDPTNVARQLQRINEINQRGAQLQKLKVNTIRANHGLPPMSTKDYENQSAALGDNEQPAGTPKPTQSVIKDNGAMMEVDGEPVAVVSRNKDGSVTVKRKNGTLGTVRQ